MLKTPVQEKLEAQRGKEFSVILIETLECFRGRKNIAQLAAIELDVSDGTIYRWCNDCGINIDDYKQPVASGVGTEEG